jgi:hypothetical protein
MRESIVYRSRLTVRIDPASYAERSLGPLKNAGFRDDAVFLK